MTQQTAWWDHVHRKCPHVAWIEETAQSSLACFCHFTMTVVSEKVCLSFCLFLRLSVCTRLSHCLKLPLLRATTHPRVLGLPDTRSIHLICVFVRVCVQCVCTVCVCVCVCVCVPKLTVGGFGIKDLVFWL